VVSFSSLTRPGGNITGIGLLAADLAGRRLQLLSEIVPRLARVAVLLNPANPSHLALLKQTQAAASLLKIELHLAQAGTPDPTISSPSRNPRRLMNKISLPDWCSAACK
jgi:ABC-type uncharacterized transport system substrate-binding protein